MCSLDSVSAAAGKDLCESCTSRTANSNRDFVFKHLPGREMKRLLSQFSDFQENGGQLYLEQHFESRKFR